MKWVESLVWGGRECSACSGCGGESANAKRDVWETGWLRMERWLWVSQRGDRGKCKPDRKAQIDGVAPAHSLIRAPQPTP